jgi:hypothetical protein
VPPQRGLADAQALGTLPRGESGPKEAQHLGFARCQSKLPHVDPHPTASRTSRRSSAFRPTTLTMSARLVIRSSAVTPNQTDAFGNRCRHLRHETTKASPDSNEISTNTGVLVGTLVATGGDRCLGTRVDRSNPTGPSGRRYERRRPNPHESAHCPWCDDVLDSGSPGICAKCVPEALRAVQERLDAK